MKRMFKISVVILVVGLVLLGIGFAGHGMKNVQFKGMHPVVEHRVTRSLVTNKNFQKIDLKSASANVVIKSGDQYAVKYRGSDARAPKVKVADGILRIKQSYSNGFFFTTDHDEDTVIITVPRDKQLSGKIKTADGSLNIANVDLKNLDVNAADGDVYYSHLTIEGGKTILGDGDFTSSNVTFRGRYTVKNSDGDNKVIASHADGFILHSTDGDNKLDGVDHGEEELQQNPSANNLLRLESVDGDNSVINIQAVQ